MDWIADRARRIDAAIRFLKSRCILVTVHDRDHPLRCYWVSGKRNLHLAEDVIALAESLGWADGASATPLPRKTA